MFLKFFTCYTTNLIKKIFKYELRFVVFTWPNLCSLDLCLWDVFVMLAGHNFVSSIYKLKPKNLIFL